MRRPGQQAYLDFVYLDGRHDHAGVLQDLNAWWPRVCAGGALAGHDYTDLDNVARAVGEFFGRAGHGAGADLFVTAENPASFLIFKGPSQ